MPNCEHLTESIIGSHGLFECFSCNRKFRLDEFKQAEREETIAVCSECGKDVPLTPDSLANVGYLCNDCDNYVAIPFEDEFLHPRSILKLAWNEDLPGKGVCLADGFFVGECSSDKDWQVLTLLQVLAMEEDDRFKFATKGEYGAALAFDPGRGEYMGYVLGYVGDRDYATLNQIYVIPERRRRGFAEAMVKHWVASVADKLGDTFVIEAPNEAAINLHIKLGHIKREGGQTVGVKCRLTYGF